MISSDYLDKALLLSAIFLLVLLQYPVAPSDPLQYLELALSPSSTTFFIDRLTLMSLIKLCSSIVSVEYSVYYLSVITMLISVFVSYKLMTKETNISLIGLITVLLFNYIVISNLGYGYPTQVGFCLQISAFYFVFYKKDSFLNTLISSLLIISLLFSKIQFIPSGLLVFLMFSYRMYKSKKILELFSAMVLSGVVFLLLVSLILDSNLITLVKGYFSGEFSKQYEGRNAGGLPPFYVFAFEPAFIMATIGVIGTLRSSLDKKFKILAMFAIVDLMFLMAIYAITGRGGPVIFNYFYSYYFIGSLLFYLVYLKDTNINYSRLAVCLFIAVIFFSSFLYPLGFSYLSLGKYLTYKVSFVLLGLAFSSVYLLRHRIKANASLLFLILFLGPGVSSIFELNFKRSLSLGYMTALESIEDGTEFCYANSDDKFLNRYINSSFLLTNEKESKKSYFCDIEDERKPINVLRSSIRGFYVKGI
jgi:hypothetical protein